MLDVFRPLLEAAHGIDLADAAAAERELALRFDPRSEAAQSLNRRLTELLERGDIAQRGAPPVRWSRVTKAGPQSLDFSIDVVHMSGAGPRHLHPRGEVNYCVALEGTPTFEEKPAGWVVLPSGSTHVPTVERGTMLIVYLLPAGAIEFGE